MGTLTIGQVAERTGFSASSLRYYEGIGLVVPAARTDAGYRLYDEGVVDRLAFVARAKQLGCTLGEIADMVAIWDGDECGPVQRRLHDLITTKIAETQQRLTELAGFAAQLRAAAVRLSVAAPTDGPCDADCACLAPAAAGTTAVLGPAPEPADEVPSACDLSAAALEEREQDWADLLTHVSVRTTAPDGALRLAFDATTPVAELMRLVAAEHGCCPFFAFTITVEAGGPTLDVRAPADAAPVVHRLFGGAGQGRARPSIRQGTELAS